MKRKWNCTWLFSIFVGTAALALALAPPAWGEPTGNGTLTVNPGGTSGSCNPTGSGFEDFDTPHWWDVHQGDTIHINIAPAHSICTAGTNLNHECTSNAECSDNAGGCTVNVKTCTNAGSTFGQSCTNNNACDSTTTGVCAVTSHKCSSNSPNSGNVCTTDAECHIAGTCSLALECSGDTTVIVKGNTATPCTQDSDCTGISVAKCDTGAGLCAFEDTIDATVISGQIDVCYTTRGDACATAKVAYCDGEFRANVPNPANTQVFIPTFLRTVGSSDDQPCTDDSECGSGGTCVNSKCEEVLNTSAECSSNLPPPDCTNQVGSLCCGLTQGAYGAPNSVATAAGSTGDCSGTGLGFIPAAICQGCNPFTGDPNATTIGIHGTRAVTINNLKTLIAYLPAGGTPNPLASSTAADLHYLGGTITPPNSNVSGSGSKGNGGGALAGQTMACELNSFLSACTPPFGGSGTFTASGFGGFTLPSAGTLICTKRSGSDKVLGTGDDVCEAFSYPSCVATLTVSQVVACANQLLGGTTNSCGCSASDLTAALNNINVEFDQCGNVIDCGSQTTPGVFTCAP